MNLAFTLVALGVVDRREASAPDAVRFGGAREHLYRDGVLLSWVLKDCTNAVIGACSVGSYAMSPRPVTLGGRFQKYFQIAFAAAMAVAILHYGLPVSC